MRYWGAVPEAGNWVRVVVAEDRLHTAFLDGNQRRRWGDTNMKKTKDPKLLIHYYSDTDTLVLRNEMPAGYGQTVAENVTASQNRDGDVTGVTIEHASELLRPYLFPDSEGSKDLKHAVTSSDVEEN